MEILFFEDTQEQADALAEALRKALADGGTANRFQSTLDVRDGTHAERLIAEIWHQSLDGVDLFVADRDLSKTTGFIGLSEPIVRKVAEELAIPECTYTRNMDPAEFLMSRDQREESIAVRIDQSWDECAKQILSIGNGFKSIRNQLVTIGDHLFQMKTPGEVMAAILQRPDYAEKINQYASGDRHRLHSVLELRGLESNEKVKRYSCLFGYWLWDSILRYPGVVVNEVAAASYLNVKQEEFDADLQHCFAAAEYAGPFAEAKGKMWWRAELDDIVFATDFPDGRSLAAAKLNREIASSECCEDSTIEAGYYCMLSGKPVSLENSTGGLAWFPRGADLARISKSEDEELGPWLS